jgi:hypothetical protein
MGNQLYMSIPPVIRTSQIRLARATLNGKLTPATSRGSFQTGQGHGCPSNAKNVLTKKAAKPVSAPRIKPNKMFEKLDKTALALATKIAHKLQRLTGLTSYSVARIGIAISATTLILGAINYGRQFLAFHTSFSEMVGNGICLIPLVWRTAILQKAEESLGSNVKPAILLIQLTESPRWRLIWAIVLLVEALFSWPALIRSHYIFCEGFYAVGYPLGVLVFSYFVAVDPLPPGTSKLREWLGNLFSLPPQASPVSR